MDTTKFDFKKDYMDWLAGRIDQTQIDDNVYRFTMPFLDRHNDQIEVYIIYDGETFTITDDGTTIRDLQLSGLNLKSNSNRKRAFDLILNSHGVSKDKYDALYVTGTKRELSVKKHLLAQCMQKVGDLFYTQQTKSESFFLTDVRDFLDTKDIRYTPRVMFTGKSRLQAEYDFAIPRSKDAPERIIQVVNRLDINYTKAIIFNWTDIVDTRDKGAELYTFISDTEKATSKDLLTALSEYDIQSVPWSKREDFAEILSA